ncbi:MAG: VIT1/CCC1 transporter family protein [Acidobacteriota bacterium]
MDHDHSPEAIRARLAGAPRVSYLRDWVYGGIDGSVTTFAVVTGVRGADLASRIILILGIANLLADGFSMAASNYLGTRTERQEEEALREREQRHIRTDPEGEREEVRQILEKRGFAGADLERAVTTVTADDSRWIEFMLAEEYGLARVTRPASAAALATFAAFLLCGIVPLLPFLLRFPHAFATSVAMTACAFFLIGSVRSRWLLLSWWRAGLETLAMGSVAATLAYLAGVVIARAAG